MPDEKRVTLIPQSHKLPPRYINVAVYCRVSTHHAAQEESLETQVDKYQKLIAKNNNWKLVDVYCDVASGKNTSGRSEFSRLLADCADGRVDLILTKSLTRFGRNTVDILRNIYTLRSYNVDAIFELENMRISETGKDFLLSILSSIAQEESLSRSENIKMGIEYKLKNGTSHLYFRPCYGYYKDANGRLLIDDAKAKNVQLIFHLYTHGHSVVSIIKELAKLGIKSPSGKAEWSKRAIETLLSNEKYTGKVLVGKTYSGEFPNNIRLKNNGERAQYLAEGCHEPIIQDTVFKEAQRERERRSNVHIVDGEKCRKDTRYKSCPENE